MAEWDTKIRSIQRQSVASSKMKDWIYGDAIGRARDNYSFLYFGVFPVPSHSKSIKARLFSVCILVAFFLLVLLIYPTIVIRPKLRHPFRVFPRQAFSFRPLQVVNPSRLNQTLLALAQIDLSEREERRQITNILDGTWARGTDGSYSRFVDMLERGVYDRVLGGGRPARPKERLPVQLTSPRYAPFWPHFRSLLQTWVQKKRFDPQVMKELVHLVKDPIDKHYTSIGNQEMQPSKPYKSCAVVGNSGILLNSSYASLIDSHEMVMRLNNARTAGFERFVGSKTTIAFVNSNILTACSRRPRCFCHPYGENVPIILYICQVVHFMDVALCGSFHHAPIVVTDARFDMLCARIVKYYSLRNFVRITGKRPEDWTDAHDGPMFHYSSGMQAVTLALGICDKVSIFGFGKSSTAKHHYHTNQKGELHLHDYAAEYQYYYDLANGSSAMVPFLRESGFVSPSVHIYQ